MNGCGTRLVIRFVEGDEMRVATSRCRPSVFLCGLLPGLGPPLHEPAGAPAEADQTKGLPPRVASVLQWLPDDTETLIVARSVSVPNPIEAADWRDYGAILAFQGLALDRQKQFRLTYA